MKTTIIEFVGIPGSGKSTVARALARKMSFGFDIKFPERSEFRRVRLSQYQKIKIDLKYVSHFVLYRIKRLFYDIRINGISLWVVKNSWDRSRYPILLFDLIRREPHSIYILDEWLVHRTIDESVRLYQSSDDFSRAFATIDISPNKVIYILIQVPRHAAVERISKDDNRFRWFAKNSDFGAIDQALVSWSDQCRILRDELLKRGLEVLEIRGTDPVDDNVTLIAQRIAHLIS